MFDVVVAGAIIEHLSDPATAIGHFAQIASEAVIIAFTPVVDSDRLLMETMNDWANPQFDYSWWAISRGLYRRVRGKRHALTPCEKKDRPSLLLEQQVRRACRSYFGLSILALASCRF
jgi:hypothetical protein